MSGIAPAGKASQEVPGEAQMETRLPSIPSAGVTDPSSTPSPDFTLPTQLWRGPPQPAAIEVSEHTCYYQHAERPPSAPEPSAALVWGTGTCLL